MSRKLPPEDAFAYYVALDPLQRSYQAVADHFQVSKRAVVKLAAREEWAKRLAEIEKKQREKLDANLAEDVTEARLRHRKMVRAMAARAAQAIHDYPLASGLEGIKAGEIAIKLERLVLGDATERTETSIEEITKREMRELLEVVDEPDDDEDGQGQQASAV